MLKLALQQRKRHPMHRDKILPWASCAPFVENSRGVLIHRPRSAQTITIHREPHKAIHYWCGNGVAGKRNLTFLAAPPADRLLCEACERNAVLAGLPSAYELAGRHVHLGKIKAVQTCWSPLALIAAAPELLASAMKVNALSIQTDAHKELRAAIANATGDDDAAPECTCAAKDMTFGRCCKLTPNAQVQAAARQGRSPGTTG